MYKAIVDIRFTLGLLLLLTVGCSGNPTKALETAPVSQSPSPVPSEASSPEPTTPPKPTEQIWYPLEDLAAQTAAALMEAEHPVHDRYRLATQFKGVTPDQLTPGTVTSGEYEVGDRTNFYVKLSLSSSDYKVTPARLRHVSENALWWASVSARVDDKDIAAAAEQFEEIILPMNRMVFGREWSPGIDNEARIHVLFIEEPDWGIYGYFGSNNEYPMAIQPYSNEKEMFVINVGTVRMDSVSFTGQLAHEYQHLIQWYRDANEDLWLNEAMSQLAYFFSGAPLGIKVSGRSKESLFADNPDIQLTSRPERIYGDFDWSVMAHYGAEELFAVYLLEQFGAGFIQSLVANPVPGVISIQQELDKLSPAVSFTDVYAAWLLANLLNQPHLLDGRYGYTEIKPELPRRELINSFRGVPVGDTLPPYGGRYYEIRGDQTVAVSFSGANLARLTTADPFSGQYAWYSNRGEESEFSLTRTFDLTQLGSATLNYKVWYELDEHYDYGYVQVSTDGGEHWTILETAHGTDLNPNGNSYGWGYTGSSLEWLSESLDLTPYAGQVIQVRFAVLTDFSLNRDGLQLDDIEIAELGFFDGAEDDSGGWEARGFVRSSNYVPVEWIIWCLKLGIPTQVERIELGADQQVLFEISGFGEEFPFAALVVSPVAPVTTVELEYELIFEYP